MTDQERIAELEATLRDIVQGACMCIPYADSVTKRYMQEVKRVASAALPAADVARIERMVA